MALSVKLAGFNVDFDGLMELRAVIENMTLENIMERAREKMPISEQIMMDRDEALRIIDNGLTPETISAAYARISRDPRPLPELRRDGRNDVEGARKSNKAIIFGLGHKSVAEHAVFNFDIMGVSRRAVEEIEQSRLQGYTEKSQRYITLDGDFVFPKEFVNSVFADRFTKLIEIQNAFYNSNMERLIDWHYIRDYQGLFTALGIMDKADKQKSTLQGLGKEDARYVLSQATEAQIGMTASARNLEALITRLRSSSIDEFKNIGEALFTEVDSLAPSVIKYTNPSDYFANTRNALAAYVTKLIEKFEPGDQKLMNKVVLYNSLDTDESELAGLIFSSSDIEYSQALKMISQMSTSEKINLRNVADQYQQHYDPKLREYELGSRVAQFILSSSAFAQLKRHRMNTLIPQKYNVSLGYTTPESISETGLAAEFNRIIEVSTQLHKDMVAEFIPYQAAEYALTNAHKRRVLFDANNRQVHTFCMERENLAAQWDIRTIANEYHKKMAEISPIMLGHTSGKHEFYNTKEKAQKGEF